MESINEVSPRGRTHENSLINDTGLNIDGVVRITLSPAMQNMIDCVIGRNVTSENPWCFVDKLALDDIFDSQEEMLEFSHIGDTLKTFSGNKVLIGYDAASKIENRFFLCTSETSQKAVEQKIQQDEEKHQRRIQRSVERPVGQWHSLGSEKEINKLRPKKFRPLMVKSLLIPHSCLSRHVSFGDRVSESITELESTHVKFDNIMREQLNAIVQASPEFTSSHVQTCCKFPVNKGTTTEFSIGTITETDFDKKESFNSFLNDTDVGISAKINQIRLFDLYKDEFIHLLYHERVETVHEKISLIEYQTFTDVEFCKGKMISSVSWHPMWDGIIAIAYASSTRCTYISQDFNNQNIIRTSYSDNPVLIWSFKDTLHPKLILDSPSEVHSIQFSNFNENLLIGGCKNGQILIWDITNRLQNAEKAIPRNIAQAKCQQVIRELMGWMKDIMLLIHVQPCVSSSLQFSHTGCVISIRWLHPLWYISTSGNFQPPPEKTSLQFITAGEDGFINIWDMKSTIPLPKKLREKRHRTALFTKPKIFEVSESPFRALDNIFQPIFKIQAYTDLLKLLPISSMEFRMPAIEYQKFQSSEDSLGLYIKKPILVELSDVPSKELLIGSFDGAVIRGSWEESQSQTTHLTKSEFLAQKVHDGPVYEIVRSPFYDDLILSVGGKIFALWKDNLPNIPIMWKGSAFRLTGCAWSVHRPNIFFISKSDGSVELWDVLVQSHKPIMIEYISGGILTFISTKDVMLGVADYDGSFKVFNIPNMLVSSNKTDMENTKKLFERESFHKNNFYKWQSDLIEHHVDIMKDVEISDTAVISKDSPDQRGKHHELGEVMATPKKIVILKRPPGQLHTLPHLTNDDIYKIQDNFLKKFLIPEKKLERRKPFVEKYRIQLTECPDEVKPEEHIMAKRKRIELRGSENILPFVALERLGISEGQIQTAMMQPLSTSVSLLLQPEHERTIREELDGHKAEFLDQGRVVEKEALEFIRNNPYISNFDWRRNLLDLDLYISKEN